MSLQANQIVKSYGRRRVVDGVSLEVGVGEIVGLLGPNGAGKTTTFHSITGFVRPDAGQILLDGEQITDLPMYRRARRGIGYLPQETSIFRGLTVAQNIRAVLEARGVPSPERDERQAALLAELNLEERADQRADTLSGGETRRVEIARALATQPSFMLLDEPFTGIDPRTVEDIQLIVGDLRSKGLSILITDHNVRETLQITDRAYIMVDGEILTSGTARELTEDESVRQLYLGERFRMDW
ncbi:MAG TPA: LPS export ABC transporter ATP-binding protein [Candidatus Latescibacteria bacterium]|nr:LPS export ABC transporter ATP-binding protein [Gemmatimonadota bacterium]MDP6981845.1 LPS export ABC transporter ATP-binding protein [Candidatus Latescibacterota bacterium]MDP7364595.1 LPS export ABC transporter ATP-binding protein [Candidatus Latescibacterota bacterium]MDP7635214.1 LPS export ABC transporter ATP-binding protein [Candidatus Latescibacterota bacterium]MEC8990465.1 LPS export ABC transporter ATP-binding protein [Candidatus Latescibacterota bacterium]